MIIKWEFTGRDDMFRKCDQCGFQMSIDTKVCPKCNNKFYKATGYFDEEYFNYAGFWLRFLANFLDGLLLFIPNMMVRGIFNNSLLVPILSMWLYQATLESSFVQGTFGKKILGIKVTDLDGNRITFLRASARFFAEFFSAVTLLIGYIMAGLTMKKQALHDIIAGTLVIRD